MSATDDFIIFGSPDIRQPEIDEVVASLASGWLGTGPKVARFEQDFARYKGVDSSRVAALNSCTAALHVSMIAAGIGPGDEVITTAMTFCATVNAIIHAGATPVLSDIRPDTLNIDPEGIKEKITDRTKAIIPVHFAGRPCDMTSIMAIADEHDLMVIEDCAHAIETEWQGIPAGTMGDFGCFSFYVTKNVVTGEGGMVISRTCDEIERVKVLSLHGMSKDAWRRFGDDGYKHYCVTEAGFKYNMTDIQAAIGIHQLARVEESWRRREQVWRCYQSQFADLPLLLPADPDPDTRHGYHLYTIRIDEHCGVPRDEALNKLAVHGVGAGVHYLAIPEHDYYRNRYGWSYDDCPHAFSVGRSTISLPLSPKLSDGDIERIVHAVRDVFS